MIENTREAKKYTKLVKDASTEMYKIWNKISNSFKGEYPVEAVLLTVLKLKIVQPEKVKNLYKLSKEYPGSNIQNASGMPILTIKLR